jgi:hypothetical protein
MSNPMTNDTKQLAMDARNRIARENPEHYPLWEFIDALARVAGARQWSDDIDCHALAALIESGLRSDDVDDAMEQFVERLGGEIDGIEQEWIRRGVLRVLWGGEPATFDRFSTNMPWPVRKRLKALAEQYVAKVESELTK